MRHQSVFLELHKGNYEINFPSSSVLCNRSESSISMVLQSCSFDLNYYNIDDSNNKYVFNDVDYFIPEGNYDVYELIDYFNDNGISCQYNRNTNSILFDIGDDTFNCGTLSCLNMDIGEYTGLYQSNSLRMGRYDSLYIIAKGIPIKKNTYSNLVDNTKISYSQAIARIPITSEPFNVQSYRNDSTDFQIDLIGKSLSGKVEFGIVDKYGQSVDIKSNLFVNLKFIYFEHQNSSRMKLQKIDRTNDLLQKLFLLQGNEWEKKNGNNETETENEPEITE